MFRTRKALICLGAAALLGTVGACAGEEDTGSAEDPIRIGASISKTGNYSESAGYYLRGIELWAKETNAAGGIGGRQVELITYDDKSSADEARLLAERLVSRDEVDLLIGPYSAPVTASVAQVAEREQVPMIASLAGDNAIWVDRDIAWSVHAYVPGHTEMEGLIDILAAKGATRLALVNEESSNFIKTAEHTTELARSKGIEVTNLPYDAGTLDFNPIVDRISSGAFDAVGLLTYAPESVELLSSLRERGVNVAAIAGTTIGDGSVSTALDPGVRNGLIYRTPWSLDQDTEGNKDFVTDFQQEYGTAPSYHAAAGFAGGQVAGAALRSAGTDRQAVIDFLRGQTIPTVLGTYQVNERGWQVGYGNNLMQYGPDGTPHLVWTRDQGALPELVWPKPTWP